VEVVEEEVDEEEEEVVDVEVVVVATAKWIMDPLKLSQVCINVIYIIFK